MIFLTTFSWFWPIYRPLHHRRNRKLLHIFRFCGFTGGKKNSTVSLTPRSQAQLCVIDPLDSGLAVSVSVSAQRWDSAVSYSAVRLSGVRPSDVQPIDVQPSDARLSGIGSASFLKAHEYCRTKQRQTNFKFSSIIGYKSFGGFHCMWLNMLLQSSMGRKF